MSATNATCIKPVFRANSAWPASKERAAQRLRLQGSGDAAVLEDKGEVAGGGEASVPVLVTEHVYTIPAPKLLEQKDTMFVG